MKMSNIILGATYRDVMSKALFRGKPVNPIDLDALPEFHKWVKDGWIYGYLIGKDVIVGEIVDFENDFFATEFWCRVKPETVGQFTGLKDENGIEIYEGDILECYDSLTGSTFTGVVKFANGSFMVDSVSITHYRWVDYVREIIGNIHETPEILRSEADA